MIYITFPLSKKNGQNIDNFPENFKVLDSQIMYIYFGKIQNRQNNGKTLLCLNMQMAFGIVFLTIFIIFDVSVNRKSKYYFRISISLTMINKK